MNSGLIAFATAAMVAATGLALAAPDKVFVADEGAGTVSVLDAASFKKIAAVPVGRDPHNVQVSPDGKLAWVTNNGEEPKEWEREHKGMAKREHDAMGNPGEVWAIDTAANKVVVQVRVGLHPAHVVLTPDGLFAYVTNGGESTVSVVDTQARREAAKIPVGRGPAQVGFPPDGRLAFASLSQEDRVVVIDPAARKVIRTV